jgi:hypothetical protein
MPWSSEQVPAELFLRHNGVSIYHTYKNDEMMSGPWRYWFVTYAYDGENQEFDVRELSTWTEPTRPPYLTGDDNTPENKALWDKYHEDGIEEKHIKAVLIAAIEKGEIVKHPEDEYDQEHQRSPISVPKTIISEYGISEETLQVLDSYRQLINITGNTSIDAMKDWLIQRKLQN